MKYAIAAAAFAATVVAQTPPGCSEDFDGTFEISPVNATLLTKRDLIQMRQSRQACTNTPVATLKGGVLIDQNNRQGEIVANDQFQFDDILQPDAKFTTGFSICANGSLAIGGSAIFYSCKSGSFSNLYSQSQGEQCSEIFIDTQACEGGSAAQSQSSMDGTRASSTASSEASSATSEAETTVEATTPATTEVATSAPSVATTPAVVVPVTPATPVAPFPTGNATIPSTATGSAPATTSTTAESTSPVPFVSGADVLAAGSKLFVAVAGIAAFALF